MPEFVYDPDTVDRVICFFEKHIRHVKGEWYGKPFKLLEWQVEDIVKPLFGQKRVVDGVDDPRLMPRRYRMVYCEIPKKQGKSAFLSGLGQWFTAADGEMGAEVYSVAGDTEQAGIVFGSAKSMIELSPLMSRELRTFRSTIICDRTDSFWRVLSADAKTKHGYNPHAILFDELHVQPNRELWDTMVQGVAARRQPVVFAITTAGWYDPESICWEQHEYAIKVRDGVIKDTTFLPILYGSEKDEDWTDPEVWRKANPSIGITVSERFFEDECRVAKEVPAKQNTFRRLHLNQWTEQATRWLDMTVWEENGGEVNETELLGRECWMGLDLSTTTDLTALALVFPQDGGGFDVVFRFWVPEENIEKRVRNDRVPYDAWRRDGFLTATPGNVVDYRWIEREIVELCGKYDVREIAFDSWNATALTTVLQEDHGLPMVEHRQGFVSMAAPTKELEKSYLSRRLNHGNHPVARWNAANAVVKSDPAGNIKPDKGKARERMDGIVALVMALGRAIEMGGSGASVYEKGEAIWI